MRVCFADDACLPNHATEWCGYPSRKNFGSVHISRSRWEAIFFFCFAIVRSCSAKEKKKQIVPPQKD